MKKSILFLKQNLLWVLFVGFAIFAIWNRADEFIFISHSRYGFGKFIVWAIFLIFLCYSIYSSTQENFFKSVVKISKMYWGWQIGIDLYIGLMFSLSMIYLNGGIAIFFIWLVPVLVYANLATLLYLALNYDSIISFVV